MDDFNNRYAKMLDSSMSRNIILMPILLTIAVSIIAPFLGNVVFSTPFILVLVGGLTSLYYLTAYRGVMKKNNLSSTLVMCNNFSGMLTKINKKMTYILLTTLVVCIIVSYISTYLYTVSSGNTYIIDINNLIFVLVFCFFILVLHSVHFMILAKLKIPSIVFVFISYSPLALYNLSFEYCIVLILILTLLFTILYVAMLTNKIKLSREIFLRGTI